MKFLRPLLFIILLLIGSIDISTAQNINSQAIQQANAMGLTNEQIQAQISSSKSSNNNGYNQQPISQNQYYPQGFMRDTTGMVISIPAIDTTIKTFGQNFFNNQNVTYEANINIPTPKDYILTSGDEVILTIWGDIQLLYKETISPDGIINVPNYGPVNLSGLTVTEAAVRLETMLPKTYDSLGETSQLMLSVGNIGSIKVNVSGEVKNPGTYTVPSLANLFHILHLSSGTSDLGNMRNIEVYRNSSLLTSLDLYDFILNGNVSSNVILKDGDVVIVKPYEVKVNVAGEAKRPMYYQLKNDESITNLLEYAGGFSDSAYKEVVRLYRTNGKNKEIFIVDENLFSSTTLIDGDSIVLMPISNDFDNILTITGAVWREGDYQYKDGTTTLKELIDLAGGLKGDAFATRGIITRRNEDYTTSLIGFNTIDVATGKSVVNLQNYDKIYIPSLDSLKERYNIRIVGEVNSPDTLDFHYGMSIEDAIILSGGLKESASMAMITVSRRIKDPYSTEYSNDIAQVYNFSINQDLTLSDDTKDFTLEPFDQIAVRRSPDYKKQSSIYVLGEVIFPGMYTLEANKTYLSDVFDMAKGLTPDAYLKGVSLIRTSNPSRKAGDNTNNEDYFTQEDISKLALDKLKDALASSSDSLGSSAVDMKFTTIGVDVEQILKDPKGVNDITLQEGDIIYIPKLNNTVNIVGGVYYPNATSYSTTKLKHYIGESGGYSKGCVRKPFVIYANGKVKSTKRVLFFKSYPKIDPGSIVVVPLKPANSKMSLGETISMITGMTSVAASLSAMALSL